MNWEPFDVIESGVHGEPPRLLGTKEGLEDRLRSAAFAEIQAREAFLWAANKFEDAPIELRNAWRKLAIEEDKHMNWLLNRMVELGMDVKAKKVSLRLWHSFMGCQTAKEFAEYMASAEERGRKAGERFYLNLKNEDPVSAEIFRKIAEEEVQHIKIAERYFPGKVFTYLSSQTPLHLVPSHSTESLPSP
jgi:uncharacterized ferritin-like protein (DUF455 family)